MEQFVLGIFQEQLAKYIVGFRKEQVNANLLNGKGEITDVELNCSVLNDTLTRMTPFLELERVHCARLSFHVTSWANLRKAPIVVDVQDVSVTLLEPLHYHDRTQQKRIRQILTSQLIERIRRGLQGTRGPYNLFDRIVDNLNLDISSVTITFQPLGKFKTRRTGPWTPPGFRLSLASVRLVSVNEFGCEAPPEECWRHNHHHHQNGSILVYKKVTMEYQLSLVPTSHTQRGTGPVPLVQGFDNQMEIQLALRRRVRDAAILAVQVDCVVPTVEVNIPQGIIPDLAHAVTGLQYCFAKDRAFVDPLKSATSSSVSSAGEGTSTHVQVAFPGASSGDLLDDGGVDGENDKGDSTEKDLAGDISSSSSSSEDGDDESEHDVGLNPLPGASPANVADADTAPSTKSTESASTNVSGSYASESSLSAAETLAATRLATASSNSTQGLSAVPAPPSSRLQIPNDRPVILLPNGLVIYDKVSFSVAMHNAVVRGTYAEEEGHVQLKGRGVILEAIWPKFNQQKGGYLQASVAYVSVQERFGSRIRTLLVGGGAAQREVHDDGPLESATRTGKEVRRDESFPMYEDRCVRPDPTGLRHTYPEQAIGVKTTVDYVKKLSADESLPIEEREDVSVLHELGLEHFDVVLDSISWCRAVRFVFDERHGGFDSRWHSGDWGECITSEMLVNSATNSLILEDFLQPSKQLFLDENEFPSSDLFNVTARVKNVELRIPAALLDDVRSCDIVLKVGEAMLVVSSALPRTFLSGKLGSSVNGDDVVEKGRIDFPNDPSDVAYVLEQSEDPSSRQRGIATSRAISTFRLQLTLRGAAAQLRPLISIGPSEEPQELLAPTELTLILCFEGEPPGSDSDLAKIVVFLSVLAHCFTLNIDLELLTSAMGTLACHFQELTSTISVCNEVLQASSPRKAEVEQSNQTDDRILKSFSGRHVLVRRQIRQSRATGGMSVAFGLQAKGVNVTLWRQNVPLGFPTHTPMPLNDSLPSRNVIPLVRLLSLRLSTIEVGLEGSFRQSNRRVVMKLCLSSMEVHACDLTTIGEAGMRATPQLLDPGNVSNPSNYDESRMVGIARLGGSSPDGLAFRIEEALDPIRTWTLAGDLDSGLELCCRVEILEGVVLLILETLLLPAWCNVDAFLGLSSCDFPWSFPTGSIGSLFLSISCRLMPNIGEASQIGLRISEDAESQQVPGGVVDKVLRGLIEKVIPSDVLAVLVRFKCKGVSIRIPLDRTSTNGYGLLIEEAEMLVSFFGSDLACTTPSLQILGAKRKDWSSIVENIEKGLRHSLFSAQKLCYWRCNETGVVLDDTLVNVFEIGYTYAKAKVFLSMKNDVTVESIELMDGFLSSLRQFTKACTDITFTISEAFWAVRRTRTTSKRASAFARSDPVELACSNAVASIRKVRDTVLRANAAFLRHHAAAETSRNWHSQELSRLKIILFKKERERLNAVALVSSQVAGWLRIGSSQRVGQRGMMSWNLWPMWALLRRSLLILYPSQTQTSVSSVINMRNASLRALAGGRTRDLKRAFAIVESSGAVHLVVAATDREYATWVAGLLATVQSTADATGSISQSLLSSSREENTDDSAIAKFDQSDGGRARRSVGVGLTRAVQAAKVTGRVVKATGQAVVDRSRRLRDQNGESFQEGSEEGSEDPDSASIGSSSRLEGDSYAFKLGEVDEDDVSSHSRRLQLRNRLSGVGQVTKSRLGSALQAARQKGKDVTQSTRTRMATAGAVAHNGPKPPEIEAKSEADETPGVAQPAGGWWSCTTCGSVNKHPITKCGNCGTSVGGTAADTEPSTETNSVLGGEGVGSRDTAMSAFAVDSSSTPSVKVPLDDAPASESTDVSGIRYGRSQGSLGMHPTPQVTKVTTEAPIDERVSFPTNTPGALKLRNVALGGPLPAPCHPFHQPELLEPVVPSRRLSGCWMVRAEPITIEGDARPSPETVKNEACNASGQEAPSNRVTSAVGDVAGAHSGITNRESRHGDADDAGDGVSSHEQMIFDSFFRILVFKSGEASGFQQVAEVTRTVPDVLGLHTTVSESLGPPSSPWFRDEAGLSRVGEIGDSRTGEMGNSLAARLGLATSDAIRVTGQILSGLLQLSTRCSTKAFLELCCDAIRECLNSMLDSSLPVEALAALVDFLCIKDFSTMMPRPEIKATLERNGRGKDLSDHDLCALSDAAVKQLVRAENQSVLAQRFAVSSGRKSAMNVDSGTSRVALLSYEPGSHRFRDAMYGSLTKVMEERDEAQARLVAAGVLHVHEMEQQRKIVQRLQLEVDALKSRQASGDTSDGSDDVRKAARALQQESEAELLSLCQQLASEISSRTSASLEIVRLKESRDLERENERAERQVLEDELRRTRELLAAERAKLERSRRESSNWKESYEEVLVHGSESASEQADEPVS